MMLRKALYLLAALLPCALHGAHPSLFMDGERVAELRRGALTTHAAVWVPVKAQADQVLKSVPPKYKADVGEQLWLRGVGDNIALLAFVGCVSGEKRYFDAAMRWARAAAAYPTWGLPKKDVGADYGLPYGHQLLGLAMLYDYGQDALSAKDLAVVRGVLIERTSRQYKAYVPYAKPYLQNHTWINITGMLAAGIALRGEHPEAEEWIALARETLAVTCRVLSPDGASQEGVGYWGYGMRFLGLANQLAKQSTGDDFFANAWWRSTARYAAALLTPHDVWPVDNVSVDFADSPRRAWWGPELMYLLASLNRDPVAQWWGERMLTDNVRLGDWRAMLWYDPAIEPVAPENQPAFVHFENMGIVCARNESYTGSETLLAVKCGAPLGRHLDSLPADIPKHGDVGHVHPDANHFILFANGEYLFKNNGYVKRITAYHSTLLVDGLGQWGEKRLYFDPLPAEPARYPFIAEARSTPDADYITGDASHAYQDAAGVKRFVRRFIYLKQKDVLLVVDDVETDGIKNISLRLFPETAPVRYTATTAEFQTGRNTLRVENLTPGACTMTLTEEGVQERHGDKKNPTPMLLLQARASHVYQVTAVSWCPAGGKPATVTLDKEGRAVIDSKTKIKL